jgi:hypothetical protein
MILNSLRFLRFLCVCGGERFFSHASENRYKENRSAKSHEASWANAMKPGGSD